MFFFALLKTNITEHYPPKKEHCPSHGRFRANITSELVYRMSVRSYQDTQSWTCRRAEPAWCLRLSSVTTLGGGAKLTGQLVSEWSVAALGANRINRRGRHRVGRRRRKARNTTGIKGGRSPPLVIDRSSLLGVLLLDKLDRQYLKSQKIVFLSTGQLEILCKVYVSLFSYPVAQVD